MPKTLNPMAVKAEIYKSGDITDDQRVEIWKETLADGTDTYSVAIEDINNYIDIPCGPSVAKAARLFNAAIGVHE